MNKDTYSIGGHEFESRFILGSGKFSLDLVKACIEKAQTQIVTLALRRANEGGMANILDYIPDYRIHLIDPARLTKEQLELFQTSLREVLGCIKYAKDKERLKEYITENTRMYMENAAAQVIKVITNTPITISEEEEIDMCQAVDEMIEDGREEGRMEGFIKAYAGLIKDGLLSVKEAASRMHMTEEKFVEEMEKADKSS